MSDAKKKMNDVADNTKDLANELGKEVQERAEDVKDAVEEKAEEVKTKARGRFARIKNTLKDIDPVYYAVAVSSAISVAGMAFIARAEKRVENNVVVVEVTEDPIDDVVVPADAV